MQNALTVGAAAKATGLPTKTVRYYADIALVAPRGRSQNGYRLYTDTELSKLVFIRRARAFGFSVDGCRALLSLYEDQDRSSADVKRLTLAHLDEIDVKLKELQALRDELAHLAANCKGDNRPDCPILSSLAGEN